MSNEHGEHNHPEWELPDDRHEQLLWRNNEVRKAAKDLRLNVEALPERFPARGRMLQMISEILTLVPVLDPEDEKRDEFERQELAASLKRTHHERNDSTPQES
jgi:hypothetical protein